MGKVITIRNNSKIESLNPVFETVKTGTTWYGSPTKAVIGDGIQFKTKRGRGNYAVIVRDKNGNKVTALKLHDEKFFFTAPHKQI